MREVASLPERHNDCLQSFFEVRDDSGRKALCLICMDRGTAPAPDSIRLRGLAQFAELVEALGGQFHLWMARPGQWNGCRREHSDRFACTADAYVPRIQDRMYRLRDTRWHAQRRRVDPWLVVLDRAHHSVGSATLAFAVLPRCSEPDSYG